MDEQRRSYISYLLRLQRVRSHGRWVWRASLESPVSGNRQSFQDLPTLFAFLEAQTGSETPQDETDLES
ncbi:MAG: hypothetical protein ACE5HA_19130 [Anaerolineae bacterium]